MHSPGNCYYRSVTHNVTRYNVYACVDTRTGMANLPPGLDHGCAVISYVWLWGYFTISGNKMGNSWLVFRELPRWDANEVALELKDEAGLTASSERDASGGVAAVELKVTSSTEGTPSAFVDVSDGADGSLLDEEATIVLLGWCWWMAGTLFTSL